MPYADQFFLEGERSQTYDEPFPAPDGTPKPCWRCHKNDGPLRGMATLRNRLVNRLELVDGKQMWTIQQTIGEDGDPVPAVETVVIRTINYHRACNAEYARKRRASRSTRTSVEIRRLREEIELLKKQAAATPRSVLPPRVLPQRQQPRPRLPYDPVASNLRPPPGGWPLRTTTADEDNAGPLGKSLSDDYKQMFIELERMEEAERELKRTLSSSEAELDAARPNDSGRTPAP